MRRRCNAFTELVGLKMRRRSGLQTSQSNIPLAVACLLALSSQAQQESIPSSPVWPSQFTANITRMLPLRLHKPHLQKRTPMPGLSHPPRRFVHEGPGDCLEFIEYSLFSTESTASLKCVSANRIMFQPPSQDGYAFQGMETILWKSMYFARKTLKG